MQNTDKQHILQKFAGLAPDAASAYLNARKEASQALQLLEVGRGIISGLLLDMRTDLSSLREAHPDWADRFETLRDRLHSAGDVDSLNLDSGEGMSSFPRELKEQSRRQAQE